MTELATVTGSVKTSQIVAEAATRLDPARMTVAVVGDLESVETGLAGLGLGEPIRMSAEVQETECSPAWSAGGPGASRTC